MSAPRPVGEDDVDFKIAAALERLGQATRVLLQAEATKHGLTPLQVQILRRIRSGPQYGRVGRLASEFDLSQPTISDAIRALEDKGLVSRVASPEDGRTWQLLLTKKGRMLADEVSDWDRPLSSVLAQMSEEEKIDAARFLFGTIAALQRAGVITVARMCVTCAFFRPGEGPDRRSPNYCALLRVPLSEAQLRFDCPDHQLAS